MQSYENEARLARNSVKDLTSYISTLEDELEKVHATVKKLEPSIPNIDMLLTLTPLAHVKKLRQRSVVDIT